MKPYWVFDRWGNQIDAISNPIEARPTYLLDGSDTLELEVPGAGLAKGQRIVRKDRYGDWREYIVSHVEYRHEGGVRTIATCTDSIEELETDYLVEVEPGDVPAERALERALSSSRWKVGEVTVTGTRSLSWYHQSATEAVDEIVEAFDAELRTSITVKGTGVSERRIDLLGHRGEDDGLLLAYGHNVTAIERVVSSDPVCTALYGYGKSLETEGGGHSRKLTFGSVNGGVDWVGDDDARERYGVPDGSGGKRHAFGQVEFSDCEDASELLSLTEKHLATVSKPTVSYTVTVAYLDPDLLPAIGDTAHVRDADLDERLTTRVIKVEADDRDEGATRITFGTARATLTGKIETAERAAQSAADRADVAADRADEAIEEDKKGRQELWEYLNEFGEEVMAYFHDAFLATQRTYSGTCETRATDRNKVVTARIDGDAEGRYPFELAEGATVAVTFSEANSLANPTLNVNGSGARSIKTNGAYEAIWEAGASVLFYYDGQYWQNCSTPVFASEVTVGNPGQANFHTDGRELLMRIGAIAYFIANVAGVQIGQDSNVHMNLGGGKLTITIPGDKYSEDRVFTIEASNWLTAVGIYADQGIFVSDGSDNGLCFRGGRVSQWGRFDIMGDSEWWLASADGWHQNKFFRKSLVVSVNNSTHYDISTSQLDTDTCCGCCFIANNGDLNASDIPIVGATYNSFTRGVRVYFRDAVNGSYRINIIGIPAEFSDRVDPEIGVPAMPDGPEIFGNESKAEAPTG